MNKMKKRAAYFIIFIFLLIIEILIALYIHDNFVRPYIGDVLVVILIYTFLRTFIPDKIKLMPLYIFIFAVVVEILQYFRIVEILGFQNNIFMSVLIGSVFDIKDIICYGIGCIILGIYELHISEPSRQEASSYSVMWVKKKSGR
ncbi:MAG: DUF2809 domain-containing protein, partial [Lachnospiraceae bacterium]|nr:DUF2809 domain-containing protein [Lachnospiraceae bacterium]